jgi:hypothetical protein
LKFGSLTLEHVQSAPITRTWQEVEKTAPYREVAYRREQYDLGRSVTVTGEIRETTKDAAVSKKTALRALSDGTVRLLNFEDDSGTTLYALLGDLTWRIKTESWFTGKYHVEYDAAFLECESP